MLKIDPGEISSKDWHQYLLGAVAPRPIALVSTVDDKGVPNLAPFSYFNAFSSTPPILAFSVANKGSEFQTKDTLKNVRLTREVVINVVSYRFVRQMALTSLDYPSFINEFERSGLKPVKSDLVKPFRVAESPVNFECSVQNIIPLGKASKAGNLIICNVLRLHIAEDILDVNGRINPHKADLMGRLGRAFYARASGESIYTIYSNRSVLGVGYQQLPDSARTSEILSANNLGSLAGIEEAPNEKSLMEFQNKGVIQQLLKSDRPVEALHIFAKKEIEKENLVAAAQAVWLAQFIIDNKASHK